MAVVCGEPSGDRLAAEVLAALAVHTPLQARGAIGPHLRRLQVREVVDIEALAVMGIGEVLRVLPRVLSARRTIAADLAQGADVAVFVDAPSLCLPLATAVRAQGVPTVGIVAPQVWAWKASRTPAIGRAYDRLLTLFDFEVPLLEATFAVHGGKVLHMGHPVTDRLPQRTALADPHHVGLVPGSRAQEWRRHWPVFLAVAHALRVRDPQLRVTVPLAGKAPVGDWPDWMSSAPDISALADCRAVLTKSGTATLELAWMGVPQVVAHSPAPLTLGLGRMLVQHVDHIALPNVLARRTVVPEHVGRLSVDTLVHALDTLPPQQPTDLSAIGLPGAAERAAQVILALTGRAGGPRSR